MALITYLDSTCHGVLTDEALYVLLAVVVASQACAADFESEYVSLSRTSFFFPFFLGYAHVNTERLWLV